MFTLRDRQGFTCEEVCQLLDISVANQQVLLRQNRAVVRRQLEDYVWGHRMNADAIICEQFVELVTDYLDGALTPAVTARFDAHLLKCDGCANYLGQFRSTISTLGQLPSDQLDEAFRERLLDTFREWTATREQQHDRLQPDA